MSIPSRHSTPNRIIAASRTFFITSSTWGRRALLQSERSASLFVDLLHEHRSRGRFRVHEFVVMPDHFHALVTVDAGDTVERAVQFIKGTFAFRAGREFGFTAPVWQKGFSESRVRDQNHYARVRDYIRQNPVRRGLTVTAESFPYSSAFSGITLDPHPFASAPEGDSSNTSNGIAEAIL